VGWLVAAAVLVVSGVVVLLGSTGDVVRSSGMAGATPIRIIEPEGRVRAPAIVLAHGFSASAAMMDPMATALARAGHVVVVPDLPGHGRNEAPLEDGALAGAVGEAVAAAAERTGLPVAVAGHSMGAGAVTSWAVDNPTEATVAISLPSAEDLPEDPASPRNLLILWGSAESARFSDAALAALQAGYPGAEPGATYGEAGQGTARRAVEIAGAEHISVVYRQQSFQEVAAWLGGGQPRGDARIIGALLVLVGGVLAARPLLAAAGGGAEPGEGAPAPMGVGRSLLVLSGGAALASAVAAALQALTDRVPVAVAGYLLGWFAVGALVLGVVAGRRRTPAGTLRGLGWGALAGGIVSLAMALPARLTWAGYALVGSRPWVLVVLVVVLGAWFGAESRIVAGTTGWRRAAVLVGSRMIVVVALLVAVVLLGAPGFLTLTVPLVVPILLVLAVLGGWSRDPAAAATSQAVPLALAIATTFPLIG
jgi:pimeloyl-ACP methyl ester carboxylesterase